MCPRVNCVKKKRFILIDFITTNGSTETKQKIDLDPRHFFNLLIFFNLIISSAAGGEALTMSAALNHFQKHLLGYLNLSRLLVGASPAPLHIVCRR